MTGRIVRDARALATTLKQAGYRILTGGTDNHTVLVDLRPERMTGVVAERALQECGILANKNRLPQDDRPPLVTSGLRLGTNILAQRGIEAPDAATCAGLVHRVLDATGADGDASYQLPDRVRAEVRASVDALCRQFPVPSYLG
jgi:glycine hydroxymethyltransferase